jgi:hypothetical protein
MQNNENKTNTEVGKEFENTALKFFKSQNLILKKYIKLDIGIENIYKQHKFDLGCTQQKIIVECKSHKWTSAGNIPSAKMATWNEAMYYFFMSPNDFRKIMFVLYDYNKKKKETLVEYYLRTYKHLIPKNVEFWECKDGLAYKLKS